MTNHNLPAQRGFTLLEVLVALTIVAIALGAIIKTTAESAHNIAYLRDRTLASWVALNQINQVLLSKDWPDTDSTSSGKADMAGREWPWELRVSATSDQNLRRLEVTVRARDDTAPLATLIAFKGNPKDNENPEDNSNPEDNGDSEDNSNPEDNGDSQDSSENNDQPEGGSNPKEILNRD